MAGLDIHYLLNSDNRFIKSGKDLQSCCTNLLELFEDEEVIQEIQDNVFSIRNITYLLNSLLYANKNKDSFVKYKFSKDNIIQVIKSKHVDLNEMFGYVDLIDSDLKDKLKDKYLDYHEIEFDTKETLDNAIVESFLKPVKTSTEVKQTKKSNNTVSKNKKKTSKLVTVNFDPEDSEFWIESVRLDYPLIPQPDVNNLIENFNYQENRYCIYGESNLPWLQSQISCLTDINRFSSKDILKLFPPIRLYTRSPYMYKSYPGLEYDEDLGCILKIDNYDKDILIKNLIEYPHIDLLTRFVKIKGKKTSLPFWKYIEIDGEIHPTSTVWDKLSDTSNLPKTESFMNEYVVRKYLLDIEYNNFKPNFPMHGTLGKFLTLYAPNRYYEDRGYNSLEVGKQCILSRKSFKESRNPILLLKSEIAS